MYPEPGIISLLNETIGRIFYLTTEVLIMRLLLVIFSFSISFSAVCQVYKGQVEGSKVPLPTAHYQEEYTFDTTLNPSVWSRQSKGLHTSFVSTDELYFRSEVPEITSEVKSLQVNAWKGERVNVEILVWSPDSLKQVRLMPHDLKNASGKLITTESMELNKVCYVISSYPYGARDVTCGESPYKSVFLFPDRFEKLKGLNGRFDLPGRTVRPVWLSINIPAATPAGKYNTTIEVKTETSIQKLDLQVNVQNMALPSPHNWRHRLDLWQNPWVVAWRNNVEPWSAEHMTLLKQHLKLYADAGGTFITTYAVHSPWADNSYMIEGGMIEWIRHKNGSWGFDYKIFDQYVQLAMSVGIDKAITVYTPIPWGNRFRYLDENTGNYVYAVWQPTSSEFQQHWNIFLTDLMKHLQAKGWFNKTYLGVNENEMKETLAAIRVIKQHPGKWKITYAGDWHPELNDLLDDYCFAYGKEADVKTVNERAAKGKTTTWYVACFPAVPNNFVFSPPVEARWQGWYTAAHKYNGFLRWAYDAWPTDPMRDSRHVFWPSGDTYLVYPGGNSCIRFEKLREGISDNEKIRILKEKASGSSSKQVKELLQQLNNHLEKFLDEKDFNSQKITNDVAKGRDLVDQLTEALTRTH